MSFAVHDVTGWSSEQIAPYWQPLLKAMERLVGRFPDDMTVPALLAECGRGERTLWLILEDGAFVSFAMSRLRTVEATGKKIATATDLAGERVAEYAPALCEAMEAWASENGADITAIEGREGWKPLLAQFGYRPYAVLYRKVAA